MDLSDAFWSAGPRFCHYGFYRDHHRFVVVSVMALYVFNALEDAPIVDLSNVEVNLNNTSYIYVTDPDTQEQTVVKELYSGQNREWVSYSEIPQTLIDVTVAAEDKRFGSTTVWTGCEPSAPRWLFRRFLPYPGRFHQSPSRSSKT